MRAKWLDGTLEYALHNDKRRGFTIVELLIVIVVIGILAAIVITAFNGVQNQAKLAKVYQDMAQIHKQIQAYYAKNNEYPRTTSGTIGSGAAALTDVNCTPSPTRTATWVPDLDVVLPQSDQTLKGVGGTTGCYIYISNGAEFVLSAWNMLPSPQTDKFYRRLGFRESSWFSAQFYICNHTNIGGRSPYDVNADYYKRSVTYTNITSCVETPPAGA